MTWPACGAEEASCAAAAGFAAMGEGASKADLQIRQGDDGSFSLWSGGFAEGFHSRRGALREARETFVLPSELQRFRPGRQLRVVEVCVGTGTNLAALLEACASAGLGLEWWGSALDPAPLQLPLDQPEFRGQWQAQALVNLEELSRRGRWQNPLSSGRMLWGDARRTLPQLLEQRRNQVDLVWHDAFSPQHCPQLWTVDFLSQLIALLTPEGRWISYCSAAAVRQALVLEGLTLAALVSQPLRSQQQPTWSGGTIASHQVLDLSTLWRPLSTMEMEHLNCSAGEPYRDSSGLKNAAAILEQRREAQAAALARGERGTSSAWRKRWGVKQRQPEELF